MLKPLRWTAPYASAVYVHALYSGLVTRKAVHWPAPAWFMDFVRKRRPQGPILDLAMAVPTCLEALDKVYIQRDPHIVRAARAVHSAMLLRVKIQDGLKEAVATSFALNSPPYVLVNIEYYPTFEASMGSLYSMFPTSFDFIDLDAAPLYRLAWVTLLLLDQAILDVRARHPSIVWGLTKATQDELSTEISECVTKLCQSIPYYASPATRMQGDIVIPEVLYYVRRHFVRWQRTSHVEWCDAVSLYAVPGCRMAKVIASQ